MAIVRSAEIAIAEYPAIPDGLFMLLEKKPLRLPDARCHGGRNYCRFKHSASAKLREPPNALGVEACSRV
jgi:hypothetical protein